VKTTRDVVLETLERVATSLGADLGLVVFVGGTVAALYDGELDIRPTEDVDCVVRASLPDYYALLARLKSRGFKECTEPGAPICRLRTDTGALLDVMPVDEGVLGFSNRWYAEAFQEAQTFALNEQIRVRALSPIYFVATKLDAFRSRGHGDYRTSHDLEDVLLLLGQHPTLIDEIERGSTPVCRVLQKELRGLAASEAFLDAIPGCFIGSPEAQQLADALTRRFLAMRGG